MSNPGKSPHGPRESQVLRVLLVDDDEDDFYLLRDLFHDIQKWKIVLEWMPAPEAGLLDQICSRLYDVVLLEYQFHGKDGIALIRAVRSTCVKVPMIVVTGWDTPGVQQQALEAGAAACLHKNDLNAAGLEDCLSTAVGEKLPPDYEP